MTFVVPFLNSLNSFRQLLEQVLWSLSLNLSHRLDICALGCSDLLLVSIAQELSVLCKHIRDVTHILWLSEYAKSRLLGDAQHDMFTHHLL